jgi:vancomycin resistance protein YoaR
LHVEASTRAVRMRRRRTRTRRLVLRWSILVLSLLAVVALVTGLAFAGSSGRLAGGVRIGGVDVGGRSPDDARARLESRAHALENVPVVFISGSHKWKLSPNRLGVEANWAGAVRDAERAGDGFAPVRGWRRLGLSLFGDDVRPRATIWLPALTYRLNQFARALDRPHRDAALRLRGLRVTVVPGHDGIVLNREKAAQLIVSSLASLRREPVTLPLETDRQAVTADDLKDALQQAQAAVSQPVRLQLGATRWRIPRWRIAKMLTLPHDGDSQLKIGGPGANAFFLRLTKRFDRLPRNADFAITTKGVRVVPARDGRVIDVQTTAARLLTAALSPTDRTATISVVTKAPARSTAQARAMGITGLVGSYETIYGGDPNRIHNVQLVAQLIDRTLIAPGKEFSFNATTGARTPAKGFLEAPVIINGELKSGIGGGVCQVSTTVFNAAYEAGLKITARTNHALYIDHYPQGRDATVNYPDTDLRFVNDTSHWLLLRTFVGSSSLTVGLYGAPTHRRVASTTAPLVTTGPVPVRRIPDPTLYEGEHEIDEVGAPPRSTSVHRRVYTADGRLLYDDTWYSSYVGEPTVIRYGTKVRPQPKPQPQPKAPPSSGTTTSSTDTTSTTTSTTPNTSTAPKQSAPKVTPR